MIWELRHGVVDFSTAPFLMGVLNVTPDSFSDGGAFLRVDDAVARAREMIAEGADILDVGAESTRPGAAEVPTAEQISRVETVLPRIRAEHPAVPISIDTRSARVARRAIELGADIVNDVSAATADNAMVEAVRETGVPLILMHMRKTPESMQVGEIEYDDVIEDVLGFLTDRVAALADAGVGREQLAIDPGIGFGKTVEHNLSLMRHLDRFVATGLPVLVGASRKSFIGKISGQDEPADRLIGSVACAVWAAMAGVQMIRVHDVAQTRDALRMVSSIRNAP